LPERGAGVLKKDAGVGWSLRAALERRPTKIPETKLMLNGG
jgi:hypothetical protein